MRPRHKPLSFSRRRESRGRIPGDTPKPPAGGLLLHLQESQGGLGGPCFVMAAEPKDPDATERVPPTALPNVEMERVAV